MQADRAALPAGAFAGYHFSRAALNGSDDAATVNRLAWAIAGLTGLTALASVLVSVLGGHAILVAIASTAVAVCAAFIARKAQVSHEERAYRLWRSGPDDDLEHAGPPSPGIDRGLGQWWAVLDAVPECADLQRRAHDAVATISGLASRVNDRLLRPINPEEFRRGLGDITGKLQRVAEIELDRQSIAARAGSYHRGLAGLPERNAGQPGAGPMTAAALSSQEAALAEVIGSVTRRVVSLERYASALVAVADADGDFLGAQQAQTLDQAIVDLQADTPRDELAAADLTNDAEVLKAARSAFETAVREADAAGGMLALPGDAG